MGNNISSKFNKNKKPNNKKVQFVANNVTQQKPVQITVNNVMEKPEPIINNNIVEKPKPIINNIIWEEPIIDNNIVEKPEPVIDNPIPIKINKRPDIYGKMARMLYNVQFEEFDNVTLVVFIKNMCEFNDKLTVPFLDENITEALSRELNTVDSEHDRLYDWTEPRKLCRDLLGLLDELKPASETKLFEIIYTIIERKCEYGHTTFYHRGVSNHYTIPLGLINEAIQELSYSPVEQICNLINNDIKKLELYLSIDEQYYECTMHNIKYSSFREILLYLIQVQDQLTNDWKHYLEKIMLLNNTKKFTDVVTYMFHIANKLNDISMFKENNENNNIINYYFSVVLNIINKSSVSIRFSN